MSAAESVISVLSVIQNFKSEMSGGFYDYEGNRLEW